MNYIQNITFCLFVCLEKQMLRLSNKEESWWGQSYYYESILENQGDSSVCHQ